MNIPLFRQFGKVFLCFLSLYSPLAQANEVKSKQCKAALLAQLNGQKRQEVANCPVSEKLFYWLGILRKPEQFSPQELRAFLSTHSHWPQHEKLCKKAEEVLSKTSSKEVLNWFDQHPPQTFGGVMAYGKALLAHNQKQKASNVIVKAWRSMELTKQEEKEFLAQFGQFLKTHHHLARLDFLLWEENIDAAKRMFSRIPAMDKKIADVRMALSSQAPDARRKINSLSSKLNQHEGLLYECAKWHRKQKEFVKAQHILLAAPIKTTYAQKWWKEQNYIARELIALRQYSAAYDIVKRHKLESDMKDYAEAEWLLGWLALRFLDKPDTALTHFKTFCSNVKGAISKSRGNYWVGRVFERVKKNELAAKAYAKAARYKTTYYGQLAAAKLKQSPFPTLAAAPCATKQDRQKFAQNELVKAAYILQSLGKGASHELSKFLFQIAGHAKTKAERELSVQLANVLSPYDVVWTAKKAGYEEPVLLKTAFPTYSIPKKGQKIPETSFVLAIAYQESRFVPWAQSEKGAAGLLQILPTTAAEVARGLGIGHKQNNLLDPKHNLAIGSAHLSNLLEDFFHSYLLVSAAYNAGPTPIQRWLKEFGDPREGEVDIIDWIELIPYYETRNYVMRVLENISNYRSILQRSPRKTLIDDLRGRAT